MWKAARDLVDGRFDDADRHNDELLRLGRSDVNMRTSAAGLQFAIARERGTLADVVPLGDSVPRQPSSVVEGATGAVGRLDAGDLEGARAILDGLDSELRSLHLGSVAASVWSQLAEVACRLRDEGRALQLDELLTPFRGQLIVVAWGVYVTGSADRFLGMLAATLHRWDDAEAAFASALRLEESIRSVPLAARTRAWWARSLLDLGGDGNVERASELLETAARQAHDLGMAGLSAEIDDLLLLT
jgi:tetratricopeptide (TPR) repeat protein